MKILILTVNNQVASINMERMHFNKESLDIIKRYAVDEISHDKLVDLVTHICYKSSARRYFAVKNHFQ